MVTTTKYPRTSNNTKPHPCFTCIEPLVGYTDHPGSCKYINESSPSSLEYVADCNTSDRNNISEYECRKVVVSYRSVETFLRRDCAPKGLCSWKDKTGSMINTPVSDCVYTDEISEKLEYFAGKDLTDHFIKLLNKHGYSFESTTERENARVIKELSCSIGLEINKTDALQSELSREKYNFPNFTSYSIGDEADKCSEILFDPEDIGRNRGIHQILTDSIVKCDICTQQELCNNIILAGGITNIQGLRDRLQEELQALTINQIHISDGAPEKRQYLPWLGAAMLSTSPNLKDFWISKNEYYEHSRSFFHAKCF
ncbi:unnamed protein product [Rotaria socialis]|uniref:Actin n=1 Tax=Rotaria socialis TaxID=392032 RepID=A0A818K5B5_9BILA|nr:unnamed protein product [Rotaria socialis]